ncbi:hypothetical protein [Brevundimonas sp. FT23028]|uniref:hypothetical protein n=1 Tax=Brevundimonas sp. FT23028 TaxID=3393748 RepID=UPI003B58A46B
MTAAVLPAAIAPSEPTLAVAAGRVLTLAGTVFGLSNLFQYGVQSGLLHLHPAVLGLSWPIAITAFFVVLARLRRVGGETARRAGRWSRFGIFAMILAALSLLAVSLIRYDFSAMFWMTPVSIGIYVVAWSAAAVRARRLWMVVPALGALCAALIAVSVLGTPTQYLVYAGALFAFVLIPGAWLASGRKA